MLNHIHRYAAHPNAVPALLFALNLCLCPVPAIHLVRSFSFWFALILFFFFSFAISSIHFSLCWYSMIALWSMEMIVCRELEGKMIAIEKMKIRPHINNGWCRKRVMPYTRIEKLNKIIQLFSMARING